MNFEIGTIIQAIIGAAAGALGAYVAIAFKSPIGKS